MEPLDWQESNTGELAPEGFCPVEVITGRGTVTMRLYAVTPATGSAVILVGGVGGDWDSPAQGLYPRLGHELPPEGIAVLRVRFRNPRDLDEAVHDVLAGAAYLHRMGAIRLGMVGHSFGGAVVIRAAIDTPETVAVVTLATQSHGTEAVARLAPRCALLLLHGTADPILPDDCSEQVFRHAGEPRQLLLYPGAGHLLDEQAEQVFERVKWWLTAHLHT